jgi:arginine utilization regulatory protein
MDFRQLLETVTGRRNQILVVVDKDGKVIYLYDEKGTVFESDPRYAIGKHVTDIFDRFAVEESPLLKVLSGERVSQQQVQSVLTLKGQKITYLSSVFPLLQDATLIGAVEVFEDINTFLKISRALQVKDDGFGERVNDRVEFKANSTMFSLGDIIGNTEHVRDMKKRIFKIADSSSSVLIYGETGTGKELIAQSIHNASYKRRKKPFIAQNCAAIPRELLESTLFGTTAGSFTNAMEKPGLFELADGGTLLLDEINSMEITLQAKMLRVLQEGTIRKIGDSKSKKVDVRIIAITNMEPLEAVQKGLIRQDLYYRLNVIAFKVLPLRERVEDIPLLVAHFLEGYNETLDSPIKGITLECMAAMKRYAWPGNIRELQYLLENIVSFSEGDTIGLEDLPEHMRSVDDLTMGGSSGHVIGQNQRELPTLNEALETLERGLLIEALDRAAGNRTEAAKLMGIPRQTLNNKMNKFNIFIKRHAE